MPEFARPDTAQHLIERLERLSMSSLDDFINKAFEQSANPDRGLANLERWLSATSNPSMHLSHLVSTTKLAQLLVMILSASQSISDCLIQNPELATILYDRDELSRYPTADSILAEGRQLLSASTSYSHSLDRLRYLKQRWTLPIVVNDLAGFWDGQKTWTALSALADALIALCLEVSWSEYQMRKGIEQLPGLMVVAFGKLGGNEVNLSSDVDLVYVCADNLSQYDDKHLTRSAEFYNRALSDRMGRGSLYRVDLRLRPFGGAGALVRSMRSIEAYYRSYAETWEAQALIRSRPVVGPPDLIERWNQLRETYCFRPRIADILVDEIVSTRTRIEEYAAPNDIKRGPGGIRDIEFISQILQMVHGAKHPAIRCVSTVDTLNALANHEFIRLDIASKLIKCYEFLRKVEHRCQLVGDLQTHALPESPSAQESLARSCGFNSWQSFIGVLDEIRQLVRELYQDVSQLAQSKVGVREQVLKQVKGIEQAFAGWFDSMPQSDAYYQSLVENEGSFVRAICIADRAPALIPRFRESSDHTDNLVSGEIEEEVDIAKRYSKLGADASLQAVSDTFKSVWLTIAAQTALNSFEDPSEKLQQNMDEALIWLWRKHGSKFDIVGLGSLAQHDLSFSSDADVLFLMNDQGNHAEAEDAAQAFLSDVEKLSQLGATISVDLRLRPEGKKGLLVRSYDGFAAYEETDMELWERFALGQSRLVCGQGETMAIVLAAAYRQSLSIDDLNELLAMKKRIESERVRPQYVRRDVKLGYGGLSDIDWMLHLSEMRHLRIPNDMHIDSRIAENGLFSREEATSVRQVRHFLVQVRSALQLQGIKGGIVPENPDKLNALASCFNLDNANEFLSEYEKTIETVRAIYLAVVNRLSS